MTISNTIEKLTAERDASMTNGELCESVERCVSRCNYAPSLRLTVDEMTVISLAPLLVARLREATGQKESR
jgi:hypothetical protein